MHDTEAMVYCSDNDIVSRCIRRMQYQGEKISWSQCDAQAALFVSGVQMQDAMTVITYVWQNEEHTFRYLSLTRLLLRIPLLVRL